MERKVLASCGICNTASMNIYEIENGIEDKVLAGINDENPEWYNVKSIYDEELDDVRNYFMYGEIEYYLDEFIRL